MLSRRSAQRKPAKAGLLAHQDHHISLKKCLHPVSPNPAVEALLLPLSPISGLSFPMNPKCIIKSHLGVFTPCSDTFGELSWHKWVDSTLENQI